MRAPRERLRKLDPRRLAALRQRLAPEQEHDVDERWQTLSPWAIAVSVLALLGFGVLVGTTVSPRGSTSALVLRAFPAARSVATTAGGATPPPTTPPATPSEPTPEAGGGSEEGEEGSREVGAAKSTQGSGTHKSTPKTGGSGGGGRGGGSGGGGHGGSSERSASALPPIGHVFLIVLSEQGYRGTFGAGPSAPYLSRTLPSEGELVESYYAVAGGEPANGIALISGQGPTEQTLQGCPLYTNVIPGSDGADGQTLGSGCVYPRTTLTIANQLEGAGKTWKAYIEGVDAGGPGMASSCRHPQLDAGETSETSGGTDRYETRRNPFVYFHSLIDGSACAKDDVGIGQLASDLGSPNKTPSFAYIAPDACDDGSQTSCAPGAPAGVGPAEAFLRKVVGEIEGSAAYKEGGLIAITSDQAAQSGPNSDSSGCCLSTTYPNAPAGAPTTGTTTGAGVQAATPVGGGKVGLLLISKYVKPGSLNALGEYNHFSLLLSIEDLFGLKPLGYAGAKGLLAFDPSVYNARP
jgi:phosphatidylinositol-3-phosphatase